MCCAALVSSLKISVAAGQRVGGRRFVLWPGTSTFFGAGAAIATLLGR